MDTIKSRYQQHQYIREAHDHHHHHHQQQQQQQLTEAHENVDVSSGRNLVESTTTGRTSSVYDVTDRDDDDVKHGSQSPSLDVISSLRQPSSSTLSRPVAFIHRPFEDAAVPLRFPGVDKRCSDYRLQAVVEESRRGWLAHRHYQLGSMDGDSGSWQQQQQLEETAGVCDDEVGSSGDSACCDDDDICDVQVLAGTTQLRHDSSSTSGDTTPLCARSESNHCQLQHTRKPGKMVEW